MISVRELAAYVVVASFLALFLSCGITEGPVKAWNAAREGTHVGDKLMGLGRSKLPDFSRYQSLRILSPKEFPLDGRHGRVIVVGDVHGMIHPLNKLLATVHYNSHSDVLIHTGDILAKGTHKDSMAVLSFMNQHNITGVRGNHDQMVIEWKGWIDWVSSFPDGRAWLKRIEKDWEDHQMQDDIDLDDFLDDKKRTAPHADKTWWKLIPEDWRILGDHYRIARELSDKEYDYLLALPLRLYIPSAHAYIVHAGILPSDPHYPYHDAKRQPLASIPKLKHRFGIFEAGSADAKAGSSIEQLRYLQEMGVLTQVPQNTNPWVTLNMRSVKNSEVSRKTDGKGWFKIWANDMEHCSGYAGELTADPEHTALTINHKFKKPNLPCYPATVVYGHTASSGLNVRRWSQGLDSGCVYGRKLSALIIGGSRIALEDSAVLDEGDDDPEDDGDDEDEAHNFGHKKRRPRSGDTVPFGDGHQAQVVSVDCGE